MTGIAYLSQRMAYQLDISSKISANTGVKTVLYIRYIKQNFRFICNDHVIHLLLTTWHSPMHNKLPTHIK